VKLLLKKKKKKKKKKKEEEEEEEEEKEGAVVSALNFGVFSHTSFGSISGYQSRICRPQFWVHLPWHIPSYVYMECIPHPFLNFFMLSKGFSKLESRT
jgi:hypothetical protein